MVGIVIVGTLAAFGAFCALWALFGWLLPGARGGCLVCLCRKESEEAIVRRYLWLRGLGILRCPLVLLDSRLSKEKQEEITEKYKNIYFFTREAYILGLRREQEASG